MMSVLVAFVLIIFIVLIIVLGAQNSTRLATAVARRRGRLGDVIRGIGISPR